jgi:WD40 repeat protein
MVAFFPDGRRVLSCSHDGTVRIWSLESARELCEPLRHDANVFFAAVSSDGRRALSASQDKTVRLWDTQTGKELLQIPHRSEVGCVAFSHDGTRALSGSWDSVVRLWELPSGRLLRTFAAHRGAPAYIVFSPDDRQALSSGNDDLIYWQMPP